MIEPAYEHAAFPPVERLKVGCRPVCGVNRMGEWPTYPREEDCEVLEWKLEDGILKVRLFAVAEQEHIITVDELDAERKLKQHREFRIYSAREDLMERRPFRGDFHVHTNRSDGKEAPAYVPARYREAGFDFLAITDHHRYEPSQEAIRTWGNASVDLKLFPGEEVHPTDNPVHIVNFGGSFSVNELMRSDEARYRTEVERRAEEYADFTPGMDRFAVASSEWAFDKIREGGGVAIFAHPYWEYCQQYAISEAVTDELLARRNFDALEVLGGFYREQWRANNQQVARYYQETAKGDPIPVVGLSDSHGTDTGKLFDWYSTVVVAKSDALPDLAAAIREDYTTALETLEGDIPNVVGNFRMVRYVSFLWECYFPRHRELCAPEGLLMREYLQGNPGAAAALSALQGRTSAYRERCFLPQTY